LETIRRLTAAATPFFKSPQNTQITQNSFKAQRARKTPVRNCVRVFGPPPSGGGYQF